MAKGFKSGGRQKGSKNKANELVVTSIQRAATAGNARVHAKVLHLKLTPLEVMLANMNWAWNQANDIQRHIIKDSNATPEIKLDAFKEMLRLRDRVQSYAEKAAPYVHPKLDAVAPATVQEDTALIEVDPLREHLTEMAQFFNIAVPKGG
jgi:hypothetical protein